MDRIGGEVKKRGGSKKALPGKPLISVVTAVKNGALHLEQTILSVIKQNYSNIEYLIIDGGSTDRTIDIIQKYEKYIDYWSSEPDNGIYDGMDKGIKLANGSYFLVLNSDDYYCSNDIFSLIADYILKYPDIDFFFGDVFVITHTGHIKKRESSIDKIRFSNTVHHPAMVLKTKIYKALGGFDKNFQIAADYELVLKLLAGQYKWKRIPEEIVYFRKGGMSYLNNQSISEYIRILKKHNYYSARLFLHAQIIILKRILLRMAFSTSDK